MIFLQGSQSCISRGIPLTTRTETTKSQLRTDVKIEGVKTAFYDIFPSCSNHIHFHKTKTNTNRVIGIKRLLKYLY